MPRGEFTVTIPEPPGTLQGVRIPFPYVVRLMQFRL